MDINKAKRFLDKINREFDRMAARPSDIAQIDKDILLDYTRDFYDAVLSETVSPTSRTTAAAVTTTAKVVQAAKTRVEEEAPKKTEGPKQISISDTAPEPKTTTIVRQTLVSAPTPKPAAVAPTNPEPPAAPKPAPAAKVEPEPVKSTHTIAPPKTQPSVQADAELLALFEFGKAKELSDKLVQPVKDIWSAIGLNDRMLFTKELYKGDATAMKNSVEALNILGNFEEATSFLIQTVAVRNDWAKDGRAEFARSFVKTIRRRYF